MTHDEYERAAYMTGDTVAAGLYAQLAALQHKCDSYQCALDAIAAEANYYAADLRRELDRATS